MASAESGHETHYKHVDTQCDDEHSHESSDMRCLSRVPAEQLYIQDGCSQMHVQGRQAVTSALCQRGRLIASPQLHSGARQHAPQHLLFAVAAEVAQEWP